MPSLPPALRSLRERTPPHRSSNATLQTCKDDESAGYTARLDTGRQSKKKHSRRCSHAYGDNHARRLNIGTAEAARECARWATRDDGPLRTARLRSRCPKSLGKPGRRDPNHRRHGSVPPPPASSDCTLGALRTFFIHARDLSEAKHKRHILGGPSKKHNAGFKVSSPARGDRTVSPPFVLGSMGGAR